ncbi:MAG: hypothetical protein WAM82_19810 [Thermoanaerobaculia bacterium]
MRMFATRWLVFLLLVPMAVGNSAELQPTSVELGAEPSMFTMVSMANSVPDHTLLVVGMLLIRGDHPHLSAKLWRIATDRELPKARVQEISPDAGAPMSESLSAVGTKGDASILAGSLASGGLGIFQIDAAGRFSILGTPPKFDEAVVVHRVVKTFGGRLLLLGQLGGKPFAALFDEHGSMLWKQLVGKDVSGVLLDGRLLKNGGFMVVGSALSGSLKDRKEQPLIAEIDPQGKIARELLFDDDKVLTGMAWQDLEIAPVHPTTKESPQLVWLQTLSKGVSQADVLPLSRNILIREFSFPLGTEKAVLVDYERGAPRVRIVNRHGAVLEQKTFQEGQLSPASMTAIMNEGVLYIAGPAFRLENGKDLRGFIRVLAVRIGE